MIDRKISVVDVISRTLRDHILSGEFGIGQRITEAELTSKFGVSRATARSAIIQLTSEGLLEGTPNKGSMVRRLSRSNVVDRYRLRAQLEGFAARLAAERVAAGLASPDEVEALRQLAIFDRTSMTSYRNSNLAYHKAMWRMSRNEVLEATISHIIMPMEVIELRALLRLGSSFFETDAEGHIEIVSAITVGDALRAETLARECIEFGQRMVIAAVADLLPEGADQ